MKKDWELTRLKQLKEEEERKAELEEDEMLYAYTKSEVSASRKSKKLKKKLKKSAANNNNNSNTNQRSLTNFKSGKLVAAASLNKRNMRVRTLATPLAPASTNIINRNKQIQTRRSAPISNNTSTSRSKSIVTTTYKAASLLDSEVKKSLKKLNSIENNNNYNTQSLSIKNKKQVSVSPNSVAATNSTDEGKNKSLRQKNRRSTTNTTPDKEKRDSLNLSTSRLSEEKQTNGESEEEAENRRLALLEIKLKKKQQKLSKMLVKNAKSKLTESASWLTTKNSSSDLKLNNNTLNSSSEENSENENSDQDQAVKTKKKPKKNKSILSLLKASGEKPERKKKIKKEKEPREKMKRGRKPKSVNSTLTIAEATKLEEAAAAALAGGASSLLNKSDSQLLFEKKKSPKKLLFESQSKSQQLQPISFVSSTHSMPQVQKLPQPVYISSMSNEKPKIIHLTPVLNNQPSAQVTTTSTLQTGQTVIQQQQQQPAGFSQPFIKTIIRPPPSIINTTVTRPQIITPLNMNTSSSASNLNIRTTLTIPQTRPNVVTFRNVNTANTPVIQTINSTPVSNVNLTNPSGIRPPNSQVIINKLPAQQPSGPIYVSQQQPQPQQQPYQLIPQQPTIQLIKKPTTVSGHLQSSMIPQPQVVQQTQLGAKLGQKPAGTSSPAKQNTISALINANAAKASLSSTSMSSLNPVPVISLASMPSKNVISAIPSQLSQPIMMLNPVGHVSSMMPGMSSVKTSISDTNVIVTTTMGPSSGVVADGAAATLVLDGASPAKVIQAQASPATNSQYEAAQNNLLSNLEQQTRLINQYLNQGSGNGSGEN